MFKESAQWNAFIVFLPVVLGIGGAILLTDPKKFVLMLYIIGLISLSISKISQFYKGKWFSFGPGCMTRVFRKIYWFGYFTMGLSLFSSAVLIILQRH